MGLDVRNPAQREVAHPPSVPGLLPKLVVGAANEDVEPIRASRHRSGPAQDGGPEILGRSTISCRCTPDAAWSDRLLGRKTSSLFTPQEATLGPALKEPPRSSQSLHCGLLSDGAAENVAGRSLDGFGRAAWSPGR